jgi:hypothetical protein
MPADFGFTIDDLSNSASITSKIGEGYNPDGRVSLKTSSSQSGYEDQTLTTRDISEIMSRRCIN